MILLKWKTNMVSHLKIHNFIHNSTDVVNQFDWTKAEGEGIHNDTMNYTKGLIRLRRSSNAFRLGSLSVIEEHVSLVEAPEIEQEDVVIGYTLKSTDESETYTAFINGDTRNRTFCLNPISPLQMCLWIGKKLELSQLTIYRCLLWWK
ncbi:hypothetical protein [Shouchella miscanthi]|uniref:hypothetical protein n=1 Tax=Shouchella miscanthi TaxID=2598861 RepID=UPI0011A84A91|nr:hypothetical protein [Shouchella miscanthi]